MPRVITEHHQWVIAAFVDVTDKQARWASRRGNVKVDACKVEALDVLCAMCRRTWEDVSDQPCAAAKDNKHLRGGDEDGKRKGRKHPHHDCASAGCTAAPVAAAQ